MAAAGVPDLVRVVEAAYALEAPETDWVRGLIGAMRPALEDGLGMFAYLYDTRDRPFRIRSLVVADCPVDEAGAALLQDQAHDEYVRRSWSRSGATTASETPGFETLAPVREVLEPVGIQDILAINVRDPSGAGCWIGAPLRGRRRLGERDRDRWSRVAAHVRASLRLRLRLAAAPAADDAVAPAADDAGSGHVEAVFTPQGDAVHAEGEAELARRALRDAVVRMQRARGELRSDPDRALPSWTSMVRARWSLVDDFQADGRRYIVARTNALGSSALAALSPRERQVVACLAMGHTNKETAYELGLSHSTVRVLVTRACAKLGVASREALVEAYRRETSE